MLEASEKENVANNVIQHPSYNKTPDNLEEFKQLLIYNKMEVIDAFVDEVMSEVLRICYAYGYTSLDPNDISYILIAFKSSIMRHERISHDFQKRIDTYIEDNLKFLSSSDTHDDQT